MWIAVNWRNRSWVRIYGVDWRIASNQTEFEGAFGQDLRRRAFTSTILAQIDQAIVEVMIFVFCMSYVLVQAF